MKTHSKRIIIEGNINKDNQILLDRYIKYITIRNLSPKTINNYLLDLTAWMKYLNTYQNDLLVTELIEDDIEEYIYFRMNEGNNEDRLKRICASISTFYTFLRRKKIIVENPMEFFQRPRKFEDVITRHFLTEKQVNDMKHKIIELNDIRAQAYISLSLSTAGRISAIQSLKWEQIDFENRVIEDVLEKGRNTVELTFSREVKEILLELKCYYEIKNINLPWVFITRHQGKYRQAGQSTLRRWARTAGDLISVENFAPHSFRRTTATILKNNGMPLEDVSVVLNHKSTQPTERYIKQNKRKIIDFKDAINI